MNKFDIKGIKAFLLDEIWRVTDDEVSKKRGMFYNALKIVTLSIKEFTERRIVNKACFPANQERMDKNGCP